MTSHAIKTDPKLLDRLHEAAKREPTAAELHQQRVSFILGSLKESSSVTRSLIEEVLAEQQGKK